MKDRDFIWWTTEIVGLLIILAVAIFMIYINISLYQNGSVRLTQKITNGTGIIFIIYRWSHMADKIVWKLRKFLSKDK